MVSSRRRVRGRRSGKKKGKKSQRTPNIVHGGGHAHGVLAQWTIMRGAALVHTSAMIVIMQGVRPVLTLVVLGRLSALIATAAGMNTVREGVEAAVRSPITGAQIIVFVRGPAPMNPKTIGGTIQEVRGMGVDMPMTRGSANEVLAQTRVRSAPG